MLTSKGVLGPYASRPSPNEDQNVLSCRLKALRLTQRLEQLYPIP
jgi:hypothetical protein